MRLGNILANQVCNNLPEDARRPNLETAFTLVSCSAYFSALKWRRCSSETSVDTQRTTRRYITTAVRTSNPTSLCLIKHHDMKKYEGVEI
jgi:hypothetical protein